MIKRFTGEQIEGLKNVPLNRLLIETDAPYLQVKPGLGKSPNRLGEVVDLITGFREETRKELIEANNRNSRIMFEL